MIFNRHIDMLEGSIFKNMLVFSIPIIFTNCIQILYNAADIMVVGKFGSDVALSGVSASTSLINLIVNFFIGLSVGVNVVIASRIGANDSDGSQKGVSTSIFIALIGGIIAAGIGFYFCEDLLRLMNTPTKTLPQAVSYVKIYFLGVPGILITNFGAAILRSAGDTRRPLYFMTVSGLANILMNLIFVIIFNMDAKGVALATTISNYISASLILISLTKIEDICRLVFKKMRFDAKTAIEISKIGIPSGINSCMFSLSNVIIQSSINSFGDLAVSGSGIATNLDNFLSTSMSSVYQAAMTFTSQNRGAKKYERFKPIYFNGLLIDLILWLLIGGVLLLFKVPLLNLFTDNSTIVDYAVIKVNILLTGFILGGFMDISTGCLRGLGLSTLPMIVSIVGVCGFRILWVYTVFALFHSLQILYISYPVSWLLTFITNSIIYFTVIKKFKKQSDEV